MRQRTALEVGDDLFDDRVAAMVGLGLQHHQRRVGEHGVVAPGREQFALLVGHEVVGVLVADAAHDQPRGDGVFAAAGGTR